MEEALARADQDALALSNKYTNSLSVLSQLTAELGRIAEEERFVDSLILQTNSLLAVVREKDMEKEFEERTRAIEEGVGQLKVTVGDMLEVSSAHLFDEQAQAQQAQGQSQAQEGGTNPGTGSRRQSQGGRPHSTEHPNDFETERQFAASQQKKFLEAVLGKQQAWAGVTPAPPSNTMITAGLGWQGNIHGSRVESLRHCLGVATIDEMLKLKAIM